MKIVKDLTSSELKSASDAAGLPLKITERKIGAIFKNYFRCISCCISSYIFQRLVRSHNLIKVK